MIAGLRFNTSIQGSVWENNRNDHQVFVVWFRKKPDESTSRPLLWLSLSWGPSLADTHTCTHTRCPPTLWMQFLPSVMNWCLSGMKPTVLVWAKLLWTWLNTWDERRRGKKGKGGRRRRNTLSFSTGSHTGSSSFSSVSPLIWREETMFSNPLIFTIWNHS